MKIIFNVLILLFVFLSCKDSGPYEGPVEKQLPLQGKYNVNIYNKDNAGKWNEEADDHIPIVKINTDDEHKTISVKIPLKGKTIPLHYIEAIILTDHNKRELQKKVFPRGNRSAAGVFKLPLEYRSFVFVIVKCNLHDMWEKRVVW